MLKTHHFLSVLGNDPNHDPLKFKLIDRAMSLVSKVVWCPATLVGFISFLFRYFKLIIQQIYNLREQVYLNL